MRIFARAARFRPFIFAIVSAILFSATSGTAAFAAKKRPKPTRFGRPAAELQAAAEIDGRELFERQWEPGDARSHGGDGLGPVFNEKSCVACHKDGGVGGAGPRANNALILAPLVKVSSNGRIKSLPFTMQDVMKLHPGLLTSPSVVLHRFGVSEEYRSWFNDREKSRRNRSPEFPDALRFPIKVAMEIDSLRKKTQQPRLSEMFGPIEVVISERNTTALFGVGEIDKVTDQDILVAETARSPLWPEVTGRAVRFDNGQVGRFGWKAQQPTLRDFVATACAVELGLQVPDFHQPLDPFTPDYNKTPELDLNNTEVTALTMFIADLESPGVRTDLTWEEKETAAKGFEAFATAGCAACHRPQIGSLKGAFTDLLVHDLGQQLADTGQYYAKRVTQMGTPQQKGQKQQKGQGHRVDQQVIVNPADRNEWRTPPLWGLRDSAPYMHDGRADTVEQAIAWHGGEADRSVATYFSLPPEERQAMLAFIDTLVAPEQKSASSTDVSEIDGPEIGE